MQELSDAQLIAAYLKGDEKAFEILVKRYLKPIYSFVYKNIGNPEVAEDITQEVFVKVWKNLKKPALSLLAVSRSTLSSRPKCLPNPSKGFDPKKGKFSTWIFTIAKNASIDFLRKKKPTIPLDLSEPVDCEISPEQKAYNKSKENFLTTVLTQLSPKYKEVLVLRYQNNFTFRKIAEQLGKPINTVKSWHRRGLANLKELLVQI